MQSWNDNISEWTTMSMTDTLKTAKKQRRMEKYHQKYQQCLHDLKKKELRDKK